MKKSHALSLFLSLGILAGCQTAPTAGMQPEIVSPAPKSPTIGSPANPASDQGTLRLAILWPRRELQAIPLSTQRIQVQIWKGSELVRELPPLVRPEETGGPLIATVNELMDAATGLTVRVQAFATMEPTSVAIAEAIATDVNLVANQKTTVSLELVPVFRPVITRLQPDNGGPGVEVTLFGSFGATAPYGLRIGEVRSFATGDANQIAGPIPADAKSGPLFAMADGIPSAEGIDFRVLARLDLAPAAATVSPGATMSIRVTAVDTRDREVNDPFVSRWEVVDPASWDQHEGEPSAIGSIAEAGIFSAQAPGTAWICAYSGTLVATASISVE